MRKKLLILSLVLLSGFVLSGCVPEKKEIASTIKEEEKIDKVEVGGCKEEKIALPNYGDPGKKLKNCFVEYPGEPTREDKSYFVVEDICGQFTAEFVQNALGKPVLRIEPPKIDGLFNCSYFVSDKDYVMLVFEYLAVENQKKGQEMMGRTVKSDPRIPMENYLVWQPDGLLNTIYLVFGPGKFISIERSSGLGLSAEELIQFAANIGKEIKDYK